MSRWMRVFTVAMMGLGSCVWAQDSTIPDGAVSTTTRVTSKSEPVVQVSPAMEAQLGVRRAIEEGLLATQKEDIQALLKTVHPQSPLLSDYKATGQKLFDLYDLRYELLDYRFLVLDGDYSIVRIRQKVVKIKGPSFRDNITDTMRIFKKDGTVWKLWIDAELSTEFLGTGFEGESGAAGQAK